MLYIITSDLDNACDLVLNVWQERLEYGCVNCFTYGVSSLIASYCGDTCCFCCPFGLKNMFCACFNCYPLIYCELAYPLTCAFIPTCLIISCLTYLKYQSQYNAVTSIRLIDRIHHPVQCCLQTCDVMYQYCYCNVCCVSCCAMCCCSECCQYCFKIPCIDCQKIENQFKKNQNNKQAKATEDGNQI